MMKDVVRETAQAGQMVVWEEIARDGAQAKTLLTGPQRVAVARAHARLFGEHGPQHLIFAAGFPSICQEEVEAMRQVVAEVEECSLVAHVRTSREDINLGLETMQGAAYGRVTFIVPVSDRMAQKLMHQSARVALQRSLDMARYALDRATGMGLAVDVSLLDASRAEAGFVAEIASALAEEGIGIIKVCDSFGEFYPLQTYNFLTQIQAQVSSKVVLGVHNHNDLGFAHANNIEAVRAGVRVVATSWLGLAERNGLGATEQLMFALAYQPEKMAERLGIEGKLWLSSPDLKGLAPIARQISLATGVPLKITDPLVGTGINNISTGTAFIAPELFQPFDPETVLGIGPQVILTQLASARVVSAVVEELGFELTQEQIAVSVRWVKNLAYGRGRAVVSKEEFADFLRSMTAAAQPELAAGRVAGQPVS